MHDSDNEDEEDEIRALRIEEAINNKFNTRQDRKNRNKSFAQYVEGVLSHTSTGSSNSNRNNNQQKDYGAREKSLSVFSSESDYPGLPPPPGLHREESANSTGRTTSTSSVLTNWIKNRGNSHEKKTKKFDDPDLEMGEFNNRSEAARKESFSYLSDSMCLRDDNNQSALMVRSY